MKRNHWGIVFFVVLGVHLLSLAMDWLVTGMITKALLMPVLAVYVISAGRMDAKLRTFILLALLFSWGGDVLLMFQSRDSLFFLLGLASFLVAHLFYIFFFHQVRQREKLKSRLWTLLVVAVYYSVLIAVLNPWLGELRLPVRIYGLVISFMLLLALHMFYLQNKRAGKFLAAGAILFVLSDSILAINKFLQPVPAAGVLIMLTYGLAQFFIVYGVVLTRRPLRNAANAAL
jgi:uncharacterized membrane protein YhhN